MEKKSKFKSGIFSPECGTIEDNLHRSRPIVFHYQTVVSRRTTVPGASVGPDRVVEPSRDQAGGLQIVLEVGGQPGNGSGIFGSGQGLVQAKSLMSGL